MQINEKPNEQAGELGEEQDGGGGSLEDRVIRFTDYSTCTEFVK